VTNPSNPSIAQTFKAGDKLPPCYTLKELLPPHGSCCVWLAFDEELNRDIILHFLPDSVAADSRAMSELRQEAKRNRQLIHPRIVRVHDLVEDEKWSAISMDHVQGETFAALQTKHPGSALDPSEISTGISELCKTLEDAHRIDLFHRDLTPENILATAGGVMVQKFGISRVILDSLARGGHPIDASRDIAYISPQQLDGERPSRADDIYSLGATLFDLLTGAPPFNQGDIIAQIRKTVPPLVSERRAALGIAGEPEPKPWDDAIAACLAKNPEERPKSAAEAGSRITLAKPAAAPATSPAAPSPAAPPSGPAVAAAAAVAEPGTPGAPGDAPKTTQPPEQPAPKQQPQRRPWFSGPGKAPSITEATVLSKTDVPKGEARADRPAPSAPAKSPEPAASAGAAAKKGAPGGPTTPTGFPLRAFVQLEGESKPSKGKSSAGLVAAGVVLLLILIVGYIVARNNGGSGGQPSESSVASSGSNSETAPVGSESTTPPTPVEAASPASTPVNVVSSGAGAETTPVAVAESPAPAPRTVIPTSITDAQADQLIAAKTKAVDQAKAALAGAEKASQEKAAAQVQAAAAVQDIQAAIKQKADAATDAKKALDAASAALAQQQESLKNAQADADAAQKVAAAKSQAADQLRQAVQAAQAAAQQQQTLQQQAQADAGQLAKTVAERQQAADAAAQAAADAEKTRQQAAQALSQAQADLGQLQGLEQTLNAEKARQAADDAARIQKEREAETARLTAQAAAAAQAAADAQKALDAAKKAVADAEKAQAEAERQAEAARNGTLPLPTPAPSPESSPAATPPAGAALEQGPPTISVQPPNPHLKVDQALVNSLGMRFAPVGNAFFCIWLTRVQDFAAFAQATGYKGAAWQDPGFKQAPDHPVVNVSWNDANQFCLWLTQKEHHDGILAVNETYRLPTDLEWSNAVGLPRETGRTPESRDMDVPDVYPWGAQWPPPPGAGNYTGEETDSDVAIKGYNDGFAWTSPVGSFNVNKFGLYDMGGNVWEWCEDWWNSEQTSKVLRGGSWYNGALKLSLLSSCRIHASADEITDNYGFRVVIAEEMTRPHH
jgi:serine/threonine protein kinase